MVTNKTGTLISSLQRPGVLEASSDEVELLQTHMSWVLLTRRFAYKLKKPLNLGFADFTTLKKRCHYCQEELRVNRRLAPHLYLDVVAITGSPESPAIDEQGEPIEYAVKMKRFSQANLLLNVLQRGELDLGHMDRLAADIARFHQLVAVDRPEGDFGTPAAIRQPMEANFEHLSRSQPDSPNQASVEVLRQWSEEVHDRYADTFVARKQEGFIRECHGDLHMGNMVLEDDQVIVFDAIEFNENLRWIDVLSDVAFLAMDLDAHNRPDLGNRFRNRYLEHTGDYFHLQVLPYYLVYRALVRAKVKDIRLRQPHCDAETRHALQNEVGQYLKLAERYIAARQPQLVVTRGPSGSGKTHWTQQLVDRHGVVRIRSDVERKRLFQESGEGEQGARNGPATYSVQATRQTYHRLAQAAAAVIRAGFTVVVDAACLQRWQRQQLRATARQLEVPFHILDFHADGETRRRRIRQRQMMHDDASDADLRVLAQQLDTAEPLTESERQETVSVDSEAQDPLTKIHFM